MCCFARIIIESGKNGVKKLNLTLFLCNPEIISYRQFIKLIIKKSVVYIYPHLWLATAIIITELVNFLRTNKIFKPCNFVNPIRCRLRVEEF